MKTGGVMRTLIGQVAEGVNDVKAMFTSTGEHVLYYHSGHQTLRAFRVADGQLIGKKEMCVNGVFVIDFT